jgi:hypothetical protein
MGDEYVLAQEIAQVAGNPWTTGSVIRKTLERYLPSMAKRICK